MLVNTFFIAARSENEALNDRTSWLEILIAQILLFVVSVLLFINHILKEEIAMNIEVVDSFSVHNRLNVRETLVKIARATFIMMLSLTEWRFEEFKLKISLSLSWSAQFCCSDER